MLLTEGWDCSRVDCVVVLRPTKVRSLYSQMVGRVPDCNLEKLNHYCWTSSGIQSGMSFVIRRI
ncbi:hypothetical protein M3201_03710 [Paenibacillus motobuensis]|uniref:hypothetical protein n=1 Tax=Paenibacillus TaxID=44249 RepID=UPI00203ADBCB|nr:MULTISPECIES: hypothetical protein [Paenibacillus]MCM3038807.1 hypothetical protein [Paenibacillus lutimineralis]MCM3645911.1 hypothetical protein [Paenibacillus motobuensis]